MRRCLKGFGGNPDQITLAGQSGGSSKTTATFISPLSSKYIAGTVNQSSLNAFGSYKTQEEGYAAGYALLDAMGLSHDITAEELRAIPTEALKAAVDASSFSGSLVIDNYALVESPHDFYLRRGQLNGKNMMAGLVFGESGTYEATTAQELYAAIREQFGDELCDKYHLEEAVEITDGNVGYYNYAIKAWYGLESTRIYGEIMMKQNSDAKFYTYSFGRVPASTEWGWHSLELWYMFGSLHPGDYTNDWTVFDYVTSDKCTSYWANFIKNGDPNGYGVETWKTGENGAFMFLDAPSISYVKTQLDDLFHEYFITTNDLSAYFK